MVDMTRNPLGDLGNSLGDYLREQRQNARLSVRQLSELAGVSNPYLSQIERGLKKPSAEILQQLAKGLEVSAESLYVRAGLLDPDDRKSPHAPDTRAVIKHDPLLTAKQKESLLAVYDSFVSATPAPADSAAEEATTSSSSIPRVTTAGQSRKRAAATRKPATGATSTAAEAASQADDSSS